jgi:hypothetical protein
MTAPSPIELVLHLDPQTGLLRADWPSTDEGGPPVPAEFKLPQQWIDLAPWLIARLLADQGHDPSRELRMLIAGGDYDLMRGHTLADLCRRPLVDASPERRAQSRRARA